MVIIRLTGHLVRHRPAPMIEAEGTNLAEVLAQGLAGDDLLRSYVLDEQGRLRKHVNIYLDGAVIADRLRLSDTVRPRCRDLCFAGTFGGVDVATLWVGSRKELFRYDDTTAGWAVAGRPAFLAGPVTAVLDDPRDGALYVSLHHGHFGCKLHRSEDRGQTWIELPAPAYPQSDAPDAPALEFIWCFAAGGKDEPEVIWAGTLPGGLFKSMDRGQSWELNEALWAVPGREQWFGAGYDHPGIHSICVDPRDSRHIVIAVSIGGVWITRDGGESWVIGGYGLRNEYMPPDQAQTPELQDAHLIAACAADPDRIWCQHHTGVFVSEDGGVNWRESMGAKPSNSGFAVAPHPTDRDRAWFAPAQKDEFRDARAARRVARQPVCPCASTSLAGLRRMGLA